eukprot:TRINITY_DN2919_c0_g1_i8.p1 TRINITY_DN2919_c0_g1~~TRINITY_DN2919_c0_g1_i8.p1  ORF type:complete len:269 (-),score=33.58 TRINITY_DN2919_c0_g1_i8:75-881(-)
MFAAQAGAKHVYGVECSAIINQAKEIIKTNHFEDVITLIQGKIEEVTLPVAKVDVIISEWMGYFLLYESMLNTVIFARDKWLAPGGIILPDKANLYIAAIEDGDYKDEKINFWDNVYGFDMSVIKNMAYREPLVDVVKPQSVITSADKILTIDIYTVKEKDLIFESPFKITARRNDYAHAFVAYFDIHFTKCHKPISFSTAPHSQYTHWKQTVFYMHEAISICKDEVINGSLSCKPNLKNPRDLDLEISIQFEGAYGNLNAHHTYQLR